MVVFSIPVLVPILIAAGAYYGGALFLSDLNAFGVASMLGAVVSAVMEFAGTRGTIFFIPAAAWLGAISVNKAFGLTDLELFKMDSEPGVGFMIMAVITAIFGLLSVVGIFAGSAGAEDEGEA